MHKRKRVLFLGLLALTLSCSKQKPAEASEDTTKVQSLNPNGDSELAIIMRTMHEHGKILRKELLSDTTITPYPATIKNINQATPTDGMIDDHKIFESFSALYLSKLDSIYLDGVNRKLQFNRMVSSCVTCHQEYCYGPIPAIKKLYLPE